MVQSDGVTIYLNQMIYDIEYSIGDLGIITHKEVFDGDTAKYGYMYLKPSKRLSRLLAVEKEVLILLSNFDNQQMRTIQQAQKLIDLAKGRVDLSILMIVHKDPDGNAKLKKWGRELGLTILPIMYKTKMATGISFEKELCFELYSHDPFDFSGPVSNDQQFYGRRSEAQDMARRLQSGMIKTCMGIRKIGKTSLLNRIIIEARQAHDCKCIMIDCSRDDVWNMNASDLMGSILLSVDALSKKDESYSVIKKVRREDISESVIDLIKLFEDSLTNFILFFDEVDYITPGSPTSEKWKTEFNIFWRNLRAVYQDTCRRKNNLGVFVSGVSSKWFSIGEINGIENAALSFIGEDFLSPLPRGASKPMIKALARTSGIQFTENALEHIAEFGCDIPFWIRKTCSFIHRNIDLNIRPIELDVKDIEGLLEAFLRTEGGILASFALSHLFRVYPELLPIAVSCYQIDDNIKDDKVLSKLEKYGVIDPLSKRIKGQMMNVGFKMYFDSKKDSELENRKSEETNIFSDWADELAVINKSRNLIEQKLREIISNFLRFDSMTDKSKASVKERILRCIESDSRERIKDYDVDGILLKLYWIDLIKIITREWSLFEKLFNDKKQLQDHGAVINTRPDAHAKPIDAIEVALYRRSVDWFNSKIKQ